MSADFDPRVLWTRREAIAAGAAGAVALALPGGAAAGPAVRPAALFIADSGIEAGQARRMAELAGAFLVTIPPRTDAVRFWTAQVAPLLREGAPVLGLTGWADYLVLRGMAAENRLRVRAESGRADGDPVLARTLRTAVYSAPAAAEGRIGWALG
jgi:hypothetical protein